MIDWIRRTLRNWLDLPLPATVTTAPRDMVISPAALMAARATGAAPIDVWANIPTPAPGVVPDYKPREAMVTPNALAMDNAFSSPDMSAIYQWAAFSGLSEGLGFLGYPYLAQLTQRPEYRRISEIRAQEATRKWIKLHGADDAKLAELDKALTRFKVQSVFREVAEHDGFFGRGQIYIDTGDTEKPDELNKPLMIADAKIPKDGLKGFKAIEPVWTYPGQYNSTNPLAADYYTPTSWFVMGQTVHSTRLLTIIGREMPDILKPVYQFGGLSLSQMCKPYVDNWIRTRQSVSDLVHAFSVMILATNMGSVLQGGGAATLNLRAQLFTQMRDNLGLMMLDKASEEFSNVSVPLTSLPELLSQSQEQMTSVAGIPLVVLLGVTPSGLNASSDGEIATFHADIHSYQERVFRDPLETVIKAVQLSEFGAIDEKISFDFVTLDDADETEDSEIRKRNAEVDKIYVDAGVIDPDEVRERLAEEDGGAYNGIDLSGAAPGPPAPPLDPNKPQQLPNANAA